MLTTIHDDTMMTKVRRTHRAEGSQEEVRKPVVVEEYNRFMGGVDWSDQLLSYYGAMFHLMAVVNAYILYTISVPAKNLRTSSSA